MFSGMNPRAMEQAMKMMKKMGLDQQSIPASEVIIKSEGKDIVIANPTVAKISMPGQPDSFQISGDVEERPASVEISEDDVKTVSGQAGVSEEEARDAISKADGDLAAAILNLKKQSL